jgi:hypothetical protein
MKKILLFSLSLSLLLGACGWAVNDQNTLDITLPTTYSPSPLVGEWVNGYTSLTQVVDAYDGRYLGNTWQSGKYFKITANGKNSEFYVMAKSQYSSFATKASGTIRFDAGSTKESGSFTFLALKAHYKGWGSSQVDRDATETELKNNLTERLAAYSAGWRSE